MASLTERNTQIMKIEYIPAPVDQVQYDNNLREGAGSFSQPIGSVPTEVIGTGGKVRHAGNFSSSNPYAAQIAVATNNKDRDALYERAIGWEADRANLLEQREYDDPVNQIARQRAAGINPDLAGSSGSGGISSGSSAVQPQTQGQTKMSNAYDNLAMTFEGVNTLSSFITSISGLGTAISQMHQMRTLLPSQEKIANADAAVAEQTTGARVDIANAAASGASLDSLTKGLDFTGKLASWITPDTTFEDASKIMSAAGIDKANHQPYYDNVQAFHSNPKMQASYQDGLLQAKKSAAQNAAYTVDRMQNIMDYTARAEEFANMGNFYKQSISAGIQELLASSNYAQNTALGVLGESENSLVSNDLKGDELGLRRQKLAFDINAFGKQVEYIAKLRETVHAEMIAFDPANFPDYPMASAYYDMLLDKYQYLSYIGTQQFGDLRRIFTSLAQSKYLNNSTHLGEDGGMLFYDSRSEYANVLFNEISTNPGLFKDFMNAGLGFITHGLSDAFTGGPSNPNPRTTYNITYF